ncbi:MAG: twin transmembrane helix small protein [Gammaproteobacteria bacterium]|jgi:hypothetical protein|nr:twin transmembrane helix small protein [Gammaproteobacteria bacterium]
MSLLTITVVLALVATVITLAWGLGSMSVGGAYDEKHSEQLMFARIGIQVFAFVMLLAAVYLSVT